MRAVFDGIDAAVYIKDSQGRLLLVNRTGADKPNEPANPDRFGIPVLPAIFRV